VRDRRLRTRVEEVQGDQITLADPFPATAPITAGTEVEVTFGVSRGLYRFFSHVLRRRSEPLPHLVIAFPEEIVRIQRRRYFRLDTHLRVRFRVDPPSEDLPLSELNRYGVTENLSAGGLLLNTRDELGEGELLLGSLELPDGPLGFSGVVRRLLDGPEGVWRAGVEFINLPEADRDRVASFLFAEQRERRRLGLS